MALVSGICLTCGDAFERQHYKSWTARGVTPRYCSRKCAATGQWEGRPRTSRAQVREADHPLANAQGRVLLYRKVLFDAIGDGSHPCHWCDTLVAWRTNREQGCFDGDLIVDHLDGDKRNDALENLAPSCNRCNTLRGLIRAWREETGKDLSLLDI